jgi:hypothetical protein
MRKDTADAAAVSGRACSEGAVESSEEGSEHRVHATRQKVFLGPMPLSKNADSAGDSVSELKAEMIVENAIVSANCR